MGLGIERLVLLKIIEEVRSCLPAFPQHFGTPPPFSNMTQRGLKRRSQRLSTALQASNALSKAPARTGPDCSPEPPWRPVPQGQWAAQPETPVRGGEAPGAPADSIGLDTGEHDPRSAGPEGGGPPWQTTGCKQVARDPCRSLLLARDLPAPELRGACLYLK